LVAAVIWVISIDSAVNPMASFNMLGSEEESMYCLVNDSPRLVGRSVRSRVSADCRAALAFWIASSRFYIVVKMA
jgi:hypothetical protein